MYPASFMRAQKGCSYPGPNPVSSVCLGIVELGVTMESTIRGLSSCLVGVHVSAFGPNCTLLRPILALLESSVSGAGNPTTVLTASLATIYLLGRSASFRCLWLSLIWITMQSGASYTKLHSPFLSIRQPQPCVANSC